jgi:hypothetical protein
MDGDEDNDDISSHFPFGPPAAALASPASRGAVATRRAAVATTALRALL